MADLSMTLASSLETDQDYKILWFSLTKPVEDSA